MVSAFLEIGGQEYEVNWNKPDIGLFHQINRVVDWEAGDNSQDVYFSRGDFRSIRGWLTDYPWLSVSYIEPWVITITLDGIMLTLKVKEDE